MQIVSQEFEDRIFEAINNQVDKTVRLIEKKYAVRSEYFSKVNACIYADISHPTLEKWLAEGLPIAHIGGKYLVRRSDLDEFIERYLM